MRNQILHIFRKDVRQHWREIVLSVAIVVAYAWREVAKFKGAEETSYDIFLPDMLPLLVVVVWAFLILRAAQAESLVGDRQFWVTRPYEWKKLLAAKLLFVVVFVNVPLFILQVFLLLKAGFLLASHLSGLLWLQLLWILILILPVATLATVTKSIGQFMLAILSVLLYFAILFPALEKLVPPAASVPVENPIPGWLELLAVVGAGLTVVLWQYARRRTAQSRVLLLGAAVAAPVIMLVTPYRILIERTYRPATTRQQLPVQLVFDPAKLGSREGNRPEKNKVRVRIPLLVSGIEDGDIVDIGGSTVSIQPPAGRPWSSGWHRSGVLLPHRQHDQEDVTIDEGFFERVKSVPVKIRVSFALAPAHTREMVRVVAQATQFAMPGEGRCSYSPRFQGEIVCAFPLKTPAFLMSAKSDELTCAKQQKEPLLPPGTTLYGGNLWSRGSGPADFGLNPVQTTSLGFWDWGETSDRNYRPRVCPGTPLTFFTNWEDLQRVRSDIEIDGIRLADYKLNDIAGDATGFMIRVP